MEANNLLQSEVNSLDSRVKWIEEDVVKVRDLVKLLIAGQKDEDNQSIKTVLELVAEDVESILVNDIQEINKVITKIEKLSEAAETKTRQRRSSTNRKPRQKKEEKVVDLVDTVIEKEVQAANE